MFHTLSVGTLSVAKAPAKACCTINAISKSLLTTYYLNQITAYILIATAYFS